MKNSIFFMILLLLSVNARVSAQGSAKIPSVIFETDIGNDVDDALALDMIYKYLDAGKIKLLAVSSNKESRYSSEYVHLMNYWYGYPKIPVAKVVKGIDSENDARKYAEHVSLMKDEKGNDLFKRPKFNYEATPEAVALYRQILSKQPDKSVTIISVGFSTNIYRLLQSPPDKYSKLSGKELIAKKVKMLSMMAGSFGEKRLAEYNVVKDVPAAQLIVNEWPTPVVFTPFEAGIAVKYPAKSIENDFKWTQHHPVVEAYKYYLDMPYDRPTWDLIALLYVVENSPKYFTQTPWGQIRVDDKGFTFFSPDAKGNRAYLELTPQQAEAVKERFVNLITSKPVRR